MLLYDTTGNDTYSGTPDQGRMVAASGVENKTIGFDLLKAYALNGGSDDQAYVTGSGGVDYFFGRETYSTFSGGGFSHYLEAFDYVEADVGSTAGGGGAGYDRAYLFDTSGNDKLYGYPAEAWMELSTGVTNQAKGFDNVKAYGANGGVDEAFLYDSDGNDTFYGRNDYGYLSDGSSYYLYVQYFEEVTATAADRPDNDTVDVTYPPDPNGVDYLFTSDGDWENILP